MTNKNQNFRQYLRSFNDYYNNMSIMAASLIYLKAHPKSNRRKVDFLMRFSSYFVIIIDFRIIMQQIKLFTQLQHTMWNE